MHWGVGRPARRSLLNAHLLLTHLSRKIMTPVIGLNMKDIDIRSVCEIIIAVAIPILTIGFAVMLSIAVFG